MMEDLRDQEGWAEFVNAVRSQHPVHAIQKLLGEYDVKDRKAAAVALSLAKWHPSTVLHRWARLTYWTNCGCCVLYGYMSCKGCPLAYLMKTKKDYPLSAGSCINTADPVATYNAILGVYKRLYQKQEK